MLKGVFLLQMLSKTSVDEVFMHHFAPRPYQGAAPGPSWGTSVLHTPSLPTPGKNPAVAHVYQALDRTGSN